MRTASFTYTGPGRIALSPPPLGTRRGYRIGPASLFLRVPITAVVLRARLADLDPDAVAAELHRIVYPCEPILVGAAEPGAGSYRDVIAQWLTFAGYPVTELDPATHRPRTAAFGLAASDPGGRCGRDSSLNV